MLSLILQRGVCLFFCPCRKRGVCAKLGVNVWLHNIHRTLHLYPPWSKQVCILLLLYNDTLYCATLFSCVEYSNMGFIVVVDGVIVIL